MTVKEAQESFIYEEDYLNGEGLQQFVFKANSLETAKRVHLELTGMSVRESAEKDFILFREFADDEEDELLSDFTGCTLYVCLNNETKEVADMLISIDYIENNEVLQAWPREVKREAFSAETAYQLVKPYLG